ncbi:unnamed protein product [Rhizophagus irregularis]|nr:unnamed protein product [Rhizophagus irregularis]
MDSLRSLKIPIIQLQKSILPYNFDSGEQPEQNSLHSNNGTKKPKYNNEFDNDDRNEEQDHGQDDQVKVLDTNTDDANEDFCSTQKNDKKRTKIDTSMRKKAKPGTLVIKPNHVNSDDITINASFPHYDYNQASDLSFEANIIELKKFKELDMASIRLAEDLHKLLGYIGKLPNNPPIRDSCSSFKILPIRVQEKTSSLTELSDEFKKIAKDLSEDIFLSVMGEANEQGNKEMARRKELRFHVGFFKSYIQLQAFCEINLNRKQSETTKSQAKILIAQFYPLISLPEFGIDASASTTYIQVTRSSQF